MRISELARKAGVGVETVRYYETRGLIRQPPRPAGGGFRAYPREAVHRIRFVRRAQQLGFALKEIGELLELEVDPLSRCADIRVRAKHKLDDVNARIADLRQISGALNKLIESCPGQGPAQKCSILGTLRNGDPGLQRDNGGGNSG